jgi:hypothetical protein
MNFRIALCTFFGLAILTLLSCREKCIDIELVEPRAGDKYVLLEEFTGVRCVTCPQGAAEIANLKSIYGKNLIPIAIHAGFFAVKYPNSRFDFKTAKGQSLHDWFGSPDGYPSAVIDRKVFPGEAGLHLGRNQWANYLAQQLSIIPKVKLNIKTAYNDESRMLNIEVEVEAQEDISSDLRLTVLLKEDNMIDIQADVNAPGGLVPQYNHKYVLREILTNFDGNFLTNRMLFRDKVTRSFSFRIPEEDGWWKVQDIQVVAFVTEQISNQPGNVLNAFEKAIK